MMWARMVKMGSETNKTDIKKKDYVMNFKQVIPISHISVFFDEASGGRKEGDLTKLLLL